MSGPEVIETNRGVEEFNSRDRALVWRTMGGKNRRLLGAADVFPTTPCRAFEMPRWRCWGRLDRLVSTG